ncbi:MAG: alpha/beta-type small acid-soluble spore protein [Oscillospiraceae bacterium]|nr:alpha/beta-type small acid-soluble spore protein [Oscillospiraceae bacterium]
MFCETFVINLISRRIVIMANKQAKANLNNIKMQAANEVGVNLNNGYNGDLTARQAGSIGGMMVKKMIESYEQNAK